MKSNIEKLSELLKEIHSRKKRSSISQIKLDIRRVMSDADYNTSIARTKELERYLKQLKIGNKSLVRASLLMDITHSLSNKENLEFAYMNAIRINEYKQYETHDDLKYDDYTYYNGLDKHQYRYVTSTIFAEAYGIKDKDILDSMLRRANKLDIQVYNRRTDVKYYVGVILYMASMTQELQTYNGVNDVRRVAYRNFKKGFEISIRYDAYI